MTDPVDCIVIGAGVVGLAVAARLQASGRQVIVLEREAGIGEGISSRNSEVIHAGIYYPAGSLKARLCVAGKEALYAYCEAKSVPHARCGKLIAAVDDTQRSVLAALAERARANGVDDFEHLDARAVRVLEPELEVAAALWSPSTGIVDAHALMLTLQGDLEDAGGAVAVRAEVLDGRIGSGGVALRVDSGGDVETIAARTVVNAAGLDASRIARSIAGAAPDGVPETYFAKGSYFAYSGPRPLRHLVYPIPVDGGLGIHATLDLAGRLRFGPDVEWVETLDYTVDERRGEDFYRAIRRYWPAIADGTLTPSYAGIRPKLTRAGEAPGDFAIVAHGRVVHLLGIESPGLTAALAIGEHVAGLLSET